jgi:probable nuclear hormone receptor HR3
MKWQKCAIQLTGMIRKMIEFAKMIPGFASLSQDDKIILLKTGK